MVEAADAIAQYHEYASVLGHQSHGDVEGFYDLHGRETRAHHFKTETGSSYIAQIAPNADYGLITCHYNILADIRSQLSDSELEDLANTDHGYREHEDESIEIIGARALLLNCNDEELATAEQTILSLLENPEVQYQTHVTEQENVVSQVFVHQRVFPGYESFTPARFAEAVRVVRHYLQQAYDEFHDHVDLPIAGDSYEDDVVEDGSRIGRALGFQ